MAGHATLLKFRIDPPFDLRVTIEGHGWCDLAPHVWDRQRAILDTALEFEGQVLDCRLKPASGGFRAEILGRKALETAQKRRLRNLLLSILRLDENLDDFWERCRLDPERRWVTEIGAGRLMRSGTVFEDLMKLLFTTNCSWSLTRSMTRNLVEARGRRSLLGRRAFPDLRRLRGLDETFFRETVKVGYRARSAVELVQAFSRSELTDEELRAPMETALLRKRLLALRGFGPYAVGQACRLLGHYEDLALDSWCRARLKELHPRKTKLDDRQIHELYAGFGQHAGLALWLDLTRDWHLPGSSSVGRVDR